MLAYSTVSQLGYMMLALGVGGWVAGLFHLITHAFFKACCSSAPAASIHGCHTNDMPKMGGLPQEDADHRLHDAGRLPGDRRACRSFSGYYSKDAILATALYRFVRATRSTSCCFVLPAVGAAMTAFYMFRLWFMTFAGEPRGHPDRSRRRDMTSP